MLGSSQTDVSRVTAQRTLLSGLSFLFRARIPGGAKRFVYFCRNELAGAKSGWRRLRQKHSVDRRRVC